MSSYISLSIDWLSLILSHCNISEFLIVYAWKMEKIGRKMITKSLDSVSIWITRWINFLLYKKLIFCNAHLSVAFSLKHYFSNQVRNVIEKVTFKERAYHKFNNQLNVIILINTVTPSIKYYPFKEHSHAVNKM